MAAAAEPLPPLRGAGGGPRKRNANATDTRRGCASAPAASPVKDAGEAVGRAPRAGPGRWHRRVDGAAPVHHRPAARTPAARA